MTDSALVDGETSVGGEISLVSELDARAVAAEAVGEYVPAVDQQALSREPDVTIRDDDPALATSPDSGSQTGEEAAAVPEVAEPVPELTELAPQDEESTTAVIPPALPRR